MGYEYKLDVQLTDLEQADLVLRAIPGFEAYDAEFTLYSFRRDATGAMPDAHVKIEASGIYVCENGGSSQIVGEIRAAFAAIGFPAEPREL